MTKLTMISSSSVITFYLARNREAQKKLQRELDDALGPPSSDSLDDAEFGSGSYEQLKDLPAGWSQNTLHGTAPEMTA